MPDSRNSSLSPDQAASNSLIRRLDDSLFLKACRRQRTEYTPIWLMRQAGRYQAEFRQIRSRVGLLELCKTPELAAEVTVHAVNQLGVDAAIIFADILLPADALGLGLQYVKGEGPIIERPVRSIREIDALPELNAREAFSYVMEAIGICRNALPGNIPLIGFCGAPFTLASYLIEGGSSRNYEHTKTLMYTCPSAWHKLCNKLVDLTIEYVNAQVESGAQAIQIFDSWVGSLGPQEYEEFVLPHSQRLIRCVSPGTPVIHFGTGTASLLELMKQAGGDVIGLDWRVRLDSAWGALGHTTAVQGNLDPVVLLTSPEVIKQKALSVLRAAQGRPGHIFNLGHGVLPPTKVDHAKYLVEIVQGFRLDEMSEH